MTPLEIEESKLTGNVDSYAAWNNEIHKELKMKYYEEDNENRIDNNELTKKLNEEYNSRAFPVKYPTGQTPEELLKQEDILNKIELRNKLPEIKQIQAKIINEVAKYNKEFANTLNNRLNALYNKNVKDYESEVKRLNDEMSKEDVDTLLKKSLSYTTKDINTRNDNLNEFNVLYEKNKQLEQEAKKNNNIAFEQQDIENIEEKADAPKRRSSNESNLTNYNPEELKIPDKSETLFDKIGTTGYTNSKEYIPYIFNELNNLKNKEITFKDGNELIKILVHGNNIWFIKNGVNTVYSTKQIKKNRNVTALKSAISNYVSQNKNNVSDKNVQKASGLKVGVKTSKKVNKKDIEHYKSRFLILKGQILAGNDNKMVVDELKTVIKILDANKLLNKN